MNDLGPPILNDMFSIYCPNRPLRSEKYNRIRIPKTNTYMASKDIAIRGSYYWNDTDEEIVSNDTLLKLKNRLKQYGKVLHGISFPWSILNE